MRYSLCMTDDKVAASNIAQALGITNECDGFFEGNDYRITWTTGKIVTLAEPEHYGYYNVLEHNIKDNEVKKEMLKELPFFPKQFKFIVCDNMLEQYKIIEQLVRNPDCDEIIDCSDKEEGCFSQWIIRTALNSTQPVLKCILNSMTEIDIQESFENLCNISEYMSFFRMEYCKAKINWIFEKSISTCINVLHGTSIVIKRLQLPVLFFIVKRYMDCINYKAKEYYTIKVETEKFIVFMEKDLQNCIPANVKDEKGRIINKEYVQELVEKLKNYGKCIVSYCDKRKKTIKRPQLYNIEELGKDAINQFGYTPDEILRTVESLYKVHRIITCPYTDSQYITFELEPCLEFGISEIAKIKEYQEICDTVIEQGLNFDEYIVDDNKAKEHHAIIVTDNISEFEFDILNDKEKNILDLIIKRIILALSNDCECEENAIVVTYPYNIIMSASDKEITFSGWKKTAAQLKLQATDEEDNRKNIFTDVKSGEEINIKGIEMISNKTVAPKLYTENTLLIDMENIGSSIGEEISNFIDRASLIRSLFSEGYITTAINNQNKYIIPTKKGISLIKLLPTELYDPQVVDEWGKKIVKVIDNSKLQNFMEQFKQFMDNEIKEIVKNSSNDIYSFDEPKVFGKCPWCGSDVYYGNERENNIEHEKVYCSNKECKFSLRKDNISYQSRSGTSLTNEQIIELLENKYITQTCKTKTGNQYECKFKLCKNLNGEADLNPEINGK